MHELKVILAVLGVGVTMSSSLPAQSQATTPEEGVWFGGYALGRDDITFEMVVVNGVGQLDIESDNWAALGFARCRYQFAVSGGAVPEAFLNQGTGTPENCPIEMSFDISRTGPDDAALVLPVALQDQLNLERIEMRAGLRPLRAEDRRANIPSFDILGVAPGMTTQTVSSILAAAGFTLMEEPNLMYEGFSRPQQIWGRSPSAEGVFSDQLLVSFSAEADWIPVPPVVAQVARRLSLSAEQGVTELVLQNALREKYGPPENGYNENRAWTRDGQPTGSTSSSCPSGSLQRVETQVVTFTGRARGQINPYCGPFLNGSISANRDTGLATRLDLTLGDPDVFWADFWHIWSQPEFVRLEATLQSVSSAGGAAPEL